MSENKIKLTPQITHIEIGVRKLRKITIYPLSMHDEMQVTELFMKGLADFFGEKDPKDIPMQDFIKFLLDFIQGKLSEILGFVTDPKEAGKPAEILKDVTNLQFGLLVSTIYEVNFEAVGEEKNVKNLIGKVQTLFQLRKPSVPSVSPMDTDLNTSTSEVLEKEESPADK